MKAKWNIALALLVITFSIAAYLSRINVDPKPILAISTIIIFLFLALWEMPQKHKNMDYTDVRKAMFNSVGGNPPPEEPMPIESEGDDIEKDEKTKA